MSVPKLRFSGFSEKWNKKKLDSFLERVSNPVDVIKDQEYTQIGIRSHGKGIFHKEPIDGLGLGNKRVFWVEPNAFVVNIVFAWERAIAVTTEAEKGMIASHRFPMYLPKNNLSNVHFLRYLFVTDKGQSYLELASPGGAGRNKTLGQSNFAELKIDLPSLEEQTQIAFFLSAVDEKISQLSQKHELLSQYKQGMMQKLFSQQIRFKADDGSEFGEWEATTLGQTGKFIGGGTPSKENSEFWEGSIPWISSSDLTEESIFKINITRFISQNALNQSAAKLVPANSILIVSRVGVGKVAITPNEICTSQDFTSLTLHKGSSIFFAYLIKSLTPYLLEMNQGTSIKGFVKDDLANLDLKIPCLEEQTKIANFLSIIDQKIYVVAQQIEQGKQWKKGLLQQMFV